MAIIITVGNMLLSACGWTLSLFILVVLLYIVMFYVKRPRGLPPGPLPFPVVGTIPHIKMADKRLDLGLIKLSKVYGDIFTIYMGQTPAVVLNGDVSIKEALVKQADAFSNRPIHPAIHYIARGLVYHNGEPWREQRRFALTQLKDLGFGKLSFEQVIHNEILRLTEIFTSENGQPFSPLPGIGCAVANVLCCILLGKTFEYDDKELQDFLFKINEVFKTAGLKNLLANAFPLISKIIQQVFKHGKTTDTQVELIEFLNKIVDTHKTEHHCNNNRDFIDMYLQKIKETKKEDAEESGFNDYVLLRVVRDLFVAGIETSSSTLRWGLLYMILYPEVQTKIRDELDNVVGRGRLPSLRDRSSLPYTEAVLTEIQRLGNVAPLSVPRLTTTDVVIRGYKIPKNTMVVTNLSSVHMSEKHFPKPNEFDPRRFLDDSGNYVKSNNLLLFGAGRRLCPGESLARMEIFLFFSALIQNFVFSIPEREQRPSTEGKVGITNVPPDFKLCAKRRD